VRHYVQYRLTARYGRPEPVKPEGLFSVHTSKPAGRLPGSQVWQIAGEGRPRQYYLYGVFVADWVLPTGGGPYRYKITGRHGVNFQPFLALNGYPWFERMRRSLANFSFGLTEITHTYAPYLLQLARQSSLEFCTWEASGWSSSHSEQADLDPPEH